MQRKLIFIISAMTLISTTTSLSARLRHRTCERPTVNETYIHRYGVVVPQNEWVAQGKSGTVIRTLKNGSKMQAEYKNGVPHGETSYTFPFNNILEKTQVFENGKLIKEETNYTSGILKEMIEFNPEGNTTVKRFYEQGTMRSSETYHDDRLVQAKYYNLNQNVESGVENGLGKVTNRDPYGQLISIDAVEKGLTASSMDYHPNGMPQSVVSYKNGMIHGIRKTFLPGGEPYTLEQWENGLQHGVTDVYQDGEKVSQVPYRQGYKHGIEKRFKDENEIVEEISWQFDQRHGPTFKYIDGSVVTEWFHEGEPVSKSQYERYNSVMR